MDHRIGWHDNLVGTVMKATVFHWIWILLSTLCVAMPASAQSGRFDRQDIPEALRPWIPWVLYDQQDALCPQVEGTRLCEWPSALELELDENGGRFFLRVYRESPGSVLLPGSDKHFPQAVTLDGRPAVVLEGPSVHVPQGEHTLRGQLMWPSLPESLPTPSAVGSLELTVNGQAVDYPRREESGLLWMQSTAVREEDAQKLDLVVSRRIDDGVPLQILTRLEISVGGKARELVLPSVLLAGTQAVELNSEIPARLEPNGSLRLQVSAGQHRVEVLALAAAPPAKLTMPPMPAPWPEQEIWVFAPQPALRQVELSGAPQIDPDRANLDADFQGLATYVLGAGNSLKFDTRRRGDAEPAPNELHVSREIWLDLSGKAFTLRDHLQGTFHRDFRLNLSQGELGRVEIDERDQLITRLADATGIEVRSPQFAATAEWRLPRRGSTVPAVSWSEDAASLRATLHLPPGFALLDVDGADRVTGSLLSQWDLWDFFFVLLISLAVAKLAGWLYLPVALIALGLSHQLPDAPGMVLLWLILAVALSRVPLSGMAATLSRMALWGTLVATVIVVVPFAMHEIRAALYPQLESETLQPREVPEWLEETPQSDEEGGRKSGRNRFGIEGPQDTREEMQAQAPVPASAAPVLGVSKMAAAGGSVSRNSLALNASSYVQDRYGVDEGESAAVQTGPGVPTWRNESYQITFSGPVRQDETLAFRILPPAVTRTLSLLRVALLGLLLFGLLRRASFAPPFMPSNAAAAASLLLLGLLNTLPISVHAQAASPKRDVGLLNPTQDLLNELQTRLLKEPECEPHCVSVSQLRLVVREDLVTIEAEVHAGALGAYRVPGPLSVWAPQDILVDGKPALASARLDGDLLHVRIPQGTHRVSLRGPMQDPSGLLLQVGTHPHRVEVDAQEFEIDGLRADGTVADTLQLRRRVTSETQETTGTTLPPFVEATRTFQLGVNFRVETTLLRVGDVSSSLVVRFPLLGGESVNDTHIDMVDGVALVQFAPDEAEVSFASSLTPRKQLKLVAPNADRKQPFTVTWQVACGTLYHCKAQGLAPTARSEDGRVVETFEPYPNEKLNVELTRLPAAKGAASTIDSATLHWTPGARLTQAYLELSVRSSGGTTLRLTLPKGARVSTTKIDDQAVSIRSHEGAIELAVAPGNHHIHLQFQTQLGMDVVYSPPQVRLNGKLVNVEVNLEVPQSRWLLWARGPSWGPAVLFWGYLVFALLCAFVLSRVPSSPLKLSQWLLLSLGLTQVPAAAALTVVAWFFLMQFRSRWVPPGNLRFNLIQFMLIGLSFSAAGILIDAVHEGLVVQPDMQVAGAGSHGSHLRWYVDRSSGALPTVSIISLPLWVYKGLMLVWALWLAKSSITFMRFGWSAFSHGGRLMPFRGSKQESMELPEEAPPAQQGPPAESPTSDDE